MSEIRLDRDGPVATITLSAPNRRNALTPAMADELVEVCEQVDADPQIGAVVVQGEGRGFCSGAHRETLARAGADPTSESSYRELTSVYGAFARVGRLAPPTIAAVRGAAVGAGVNLAFATDLRIVAHDTRIIAGFLPLGLHPGGGHFTLVARVAGREAATALALFGEEIDGHRAYELGLAWQSLPAEEVEPRAHELAQRAGADPELARRMVRTMRLELGPPGIPWPVALEAETATQMWSLRRAVDAGRLGGTPPA